VAQCRRSDGRIKSVGAQMPRDPKIS